MSYGSPITNLRALLDSFGDLIAEGATVEYRDAHGLWTLRAESSVATGRGTTYMEEESLR